MASGIEPADACMVIYQQLKLGRKLQYVLFAISDDLSEIVVEKAGERGTSSAATDPRATYEAFIDSLPNGFCRWAVYDFEFEKADRRGSKLCFISWSPDDAKIKDKMLFASSREALKRRLDGIAFEVQGTDRSEISYENVVAKAVTFAY